MRTDSELYNSFLSGENAAYDELMIRHGDALTAFLNGYVHNPEDAEDLMIEAFARIMIKKPQIGEDKFKAYLYKTGRNLVTRFHFRRTRLEVFSIEELEEEPADGSGLEELFSDKSRKETLRLRKDRRIAAVSGAVCLMLFAGLICIIRQSLGTITDTAGNYYTGSSLLSSEAGGYVLIAVIAFMLGAAEVVLLRKYAGPKDRGTQRDREEQG